MARILRDGEYIEVPDEELGPPAEAVVFPPEPVSRAQAQLALYNAGLLDQLEAIVTVHPYRPVRIWYASANVWERSNPYVSMIGPELGLDDAAIDALFLAASKL